MSNGPVTLRNSFLKNARRLCTWIKEEGATPLLFATWAYQKDKGADYVRYILNELGLTSEKETDIICSAIWLHDSKAEIDGPMDEVLKDADVIHHSLGNPTREVRTHEQARFEKLCAEFGFIR